MSKIFGIPLILILLVLAIVVPVLLVQVVTLREAFQINARVKEIQTEQINQTIEAFASPTPSPSIVLTPAKPVFKQATPSGGAR